MPPQTVVDVAQSSVALAHKVQWRSCRTLLVQQCAIHLGRHLCQCFEGWSCGLLTAQLEVGVPLPLQVDAAWL